MRTAMGVFVILIGGAFCACESQPDRSLGDGAVTVARGTQRDERRTPQRAARRPATPIETPTREVSRSDNEYEPSSPSSGGRSSGMQELERSISNWRARCQPLQAAVESSERSLAEREANMDRYLENWPHNELRRQREEQYRARLEQQRAELERAREALSACEDGARRDGVSPTQLD